MNRYVIGIDSAHAGWICTMLRFGQDISFDLFQTIDKLWQVHQQAYQILIDIPIGLASKGVRTCDQLARAQLAIRRSSVFTPPCREAICQPDYLAACDVNERMTGKRISKQAWNISHRIREADAFLQSYSGLSDKITEAHPELCFMAFAGHPMQHNKKTRHGFEERVQLLSKYIPGFMDSYRVVRFRWKKSQVADDDLLDAAVLALAASSKNWCLLPLPDPPEYDSAGLPMQIVRPVWKQ